MWNIDINVYKINDILINKIGLNIKVILYTLYAFNIIFLPFKFLEIDNLAPNLFTSRYNDGYLKIINKLIIFKRNL